MAEVSDVLLNLEHTIGRARKARKRLGGTAAEHNAVLALDVAVTALESVRKRLQKDTYFSGDELRLISPMPSGLEIQKSLKDLASRWRTDAGSERGEAQTFLNELFTCYGTDRHAAGAVFQDAHASVGIMDLYWSGAPASSR